MGSPNGLRNGLHIRVSGDLEVGMTKGFLDYLYVFSVPFKQGSIGVPKNMPGDVLFDLSGLHRWQDMFRQE
jgi:hypothetical protein